MNMTVDWLPMMGALAGGAALGALFFGGLYWTTEHVIHCKRPAAVLMTSLLMRGAIVVVGFYWLMEGAPIRALAALVGFIIARSALVRALRSKTTKTPPNETH